MAILLDEREAVDCSDVLSVPISTAVVAEAVIVVHEGWLRACGKGFDATAFNFGDCFTYALVNGVEWYRVQPRCH